MCVIKKKRPNCNKRLPPCADIEKHVRGKGAGRTALNKRNSQGPTATAAQEGGATRCPTSSTIAGLPVRRVQVKDGNRRRRANRRPDVLHIRPKSAQESSQALEQSVMCTWMRQGTCHLPAFPREQKCGRSARA